MAKNLDVQSVEEPSNGDFESIESFIPDFLELHLDFWTNQLLYDSIALSDLRLSIYAKSNITRPFVFPLQRDSDVIVKARRIDLQPNRIHYGTIF